MKEKISTYTPLGRRSEPRETVDQYHSVEVDIASLDMVYQFKIWNISSKGMCILLREDSVVLNYIHVGDIMDMKYYLTESSRPAKHLKTKIQHITKEEHGRFKGHYLVGLSILEKQDLNCSSSPD